MRSELRKLAVTVSENGSRTFSWEVVELLPDGGWRVVEAAQRTTPHYHTAMAEGLLALQEMVPDLALGPREPVHHADEAVRPARKVFGFGFGLPKYGHRDDG